MTENDAKERARVACERKKGKVDINLPLGIFIYLCMEKNSQKYGHSICNKLLKHFNLTRVKAKEKRGDANDEFGDYYEIKASVSSLDDPPGKEKFTITHIRETHNFDYYLFVFIHYQDDLKQYFYLIPKVYLEQQYKLGSMNNTNEENQFNLFVDQRMDLRCSKVFEEFGKVNLLAGTTIQDLENYFINKRKDSNQYVNPMVNAMVSTSKTRTSYESHKRFAFDVKTITMVVNHLGPLNAMKVFTKSWLSPEKNEHRTVKTSLGNLYLNPRLSLRDLKVCLRNKRASNLNIKLIED